MLPKSNYKRVRINGKIERIWIGEGPEPTKAVNNKKDLNQTTSESVNEYIKDCNNKLMTRLREVNKNGVEKIGRDLKDVNRKYFAK